MSKPPSVARKRLASWGKLVKDLEGGLSGDRFSWTGGEFEANKQKLIAMGITLVTKTAVKRMGYRLKRGVNPVGSAYFFSPISRQADLYILEYQAVKDD